MDGVQFESALVGRHSVSNILAGIAVASIYGIRPAQLTEVVKNLAAPSMRGQRLVQDGVVILNDCYNSNPDAARAMIDVLRDTPAKRRIAVLGEMLELGRWSESLHRDVGSYVAKSGIDVLVGIRGEACHLVDAARQAGLAVERRVFFPRCGSGRRRPAADRASGRRDFVQGFARHPRRACPGEVPRAARTEKGAEGRFTKPLCRRAPFCGLLPRRCSIGCSTKSCFATSRPFACSGTSRSVPRSPR